MNVAIPILNDDIAPCFESSKTFKIIKTKGSEIVSSKSILCDVSTGFDLIKFLEMHKTNILICNGIKEYFKYQLIANGIQVISDINYNCDLAVRQLLSGELKEKNKYHLHTLEYSEALHRDLVNWAGKLFRSNGFEVISLSEDDTLLSNLTAVYICPVCRKPIKIGICCGGQIYSVYREIREFFHLENNRYDVCVYVHPFDPKIEQCCSKYGIEFLSPGEIEERIENNKNAPIPILKNPIESHKNLVMSSQKKMKNNNLQTQTE
jgi:predicted Fe-Mo cluster-binding NifX family protein